MISLPRFSSFLIGLTSLQGLFTNADNKLIKFGELTIEATAIDQEEATLLQVPAHSSVSVTSNRSITSPV